MTPLAAGLCKPLPPGSQALTPAQIEALLPEIPGWSVSDGAIFKSWSFPNFHETMAFVNAVAWIAHRQDHHPDIQFGYNRCRVEYSTHSIGGLSENDFICAARIEALHG